MSLDIGVATYSIASLFLFFLLVAQLRIWQSGISSFVLIIATSMTLIWSLSLVFQDRFSVNLFYLIPAVEILRNLTWFTLLLSILGIRQVLYPGGHKEQGNRGLILITLLSLGIPLLLLSYLVAISLSNSQFVFMPGFGGKNLLFGFLVSSIIGLALLEQVIRNTKTHHKWHLKFLCLGLGIMFSFDTYMYSDALLFDRVNYSLWQIRGAIAVIAIPLIAIGVLRTRQQPIQLNISRKLVFHTGVLVSAGLYLLLMASAGYYIRNFSGDWGLLLQVMFWVVSLSMLLVLIFSGRVRSLLKVYISRNLFSSKYDYREEWMRICEALSKSGSEESLPDRTIHALADIVDSPAGAIWLTVNGTHYDQVAQVELGWIENSGLTTRDYLIQYLSETRQLVDLGDYDSGLDFNELPNWLSTIPKRWLIVPLELHGALLGFVLLKESRVEFELNWEDFDLLKAAGQQAASYLAQMIASDALTEAGQFNAFNQGSAYVVHDIKTLNSQLSMLVTNAAKHKTNPSFIDDMIKTTEHAVKKMDFLLKHFKNDNTADPEGTVHLDLNELISQVVEMQSSMQPVPKLRTPAESVPVLANREELKSAISHLVQNAQEATSDSGKVDIIITLSADMAKLVIRDTGSGMTQEFIQKRLFKPFESTKGVTGMGIGVYQSRDLVRRMGGDLIVTSQPGMGTEFTMTIPLQNIELRSAS